VLPRFAIDDIADGGMSNSKHLSKFDLGVLASGIEFPDLYDIVAL